MPSKKAKSPLKYNVTKSGSLGLFAQGAVGVKAWRENRGEWKNGKQQVRKDSKRLDKSQKKVLLIGWDSADWRLMNPLMDHGLMPALNTLVNESVIADNHTLQPSMSPILWTSIATGKTADKHGILGFVEPSGGPDKIVPITTNSRKSRAIWNILHHEGYSCNVFGWWPSQPAEPINGMMVSNYFNKYYQNNEGKWTHPRDSVFPESYVEDLMALKVIGKELDINILEPFIPNIRDEYKDFTEHDLTLVQQLQDYLAECITTHAQTTWAMENAPSDFTAAYFETLDKICHVFMKFSAPKMDKVSETDFERYQYVINAAYVFHDMMLERYLSMIDENTTILLVSDHGFTKGNQRPTSLPSVHAAISLHHDPLGIFLLKGKGIKKDQRIFGVSLLDMVPTLLHHLNLSVGEDMDGKVLAQCFEQSKEIMYIDSWENIHGDFGENTNRKARALPSSEGGDILLNELASLGYIELNSNDDEMAKKALIDLRYHLSVVYRTTNRYEEAQEILEELYAQDKVDARFSLDLISNLINLERIHEARDVFEHFKKYNVEKHVNFKMLEVQILMGERNTLIAIDVLLEVMKSKPDNISVKLELAHAYRLIKKYNEALAIYNEVINLEPNQSHALHGQGICYSKKGDYNAAVESLLASIGINFDAPGAHFHLGEALAQLNLYEEAANAMETALTLNPNVNRARNALIELYENKLKQKVKAEFHRQAIDTQSNGNAIIVVSGLPRSGTSMMMQMLKAGGIEVMTDGVRKADESNPHGYYELEKVKNLSRSNSWLDNANGKAIKVITPLLKYLKVKHQYKIIVMERELNEVLDSQYRMKERMYENVIKKEAAYNLQLSEAYKSELEKLKDIEQQAHISMLRLSYSEVVKDGSEAIDKLIGFLDVELDKEKMLLVIDPSTKREKTGAH